MSEDTSLAELRQQVANQYRAVAHMATCLANVHAQQVAMYEAGHCDVLLQMCGQNTADLMETLGNILNNMDAVDPAEDDWMIPVFEAAHRLFPATEAQP